MAVARVFPNLDDFRLEHLFGQATVDLPACLNWCRLHGLLATNMDCQGGNCLGVNPMSLKNRPNKTDGEVWRCSVRRVCNKEISIRSGSFFAGSHLSVAQILRLIYFWCYQIDSQDFIKRELEIGSSHTVVDWKQFCRDVCAEYFIANPVVLGGPGVTVEIDESVFVRRKYNQGRMVREQWVFGGYEPATRRGFLVAVDRRNAATLVPLIQQYILPGTTIISDLWGAYINLANMNYVHLTVNHTLNFVNPVNGATTNHVESMWCQAKMGNKKRHGTHTALITEYMQEFMYRQRFRDNFFATFISHIRQLYPEAAQ